MGPTMPKADEFKAAVARRLLAVVAPLLQRLVQKGELVLIDAADNQRTFGSPGTGPRVIVRLHSLDLPLRLLFNPSLTLGEAYMGGDLTIEEGTLRDLLFVLSSNLSALDTAPLERLRMKLGRLSHMLQPIRRRRAKANVAHHYDLSGELYELFLDQDLQYSCGLFGDGCSTLDDAQAAKRSHISKKLAIERGNRVLDIGCGWGGLAIELAQTYGAEVTGITLSEEQFRRAGERARNEGVEGLANFRLADYREIEEQFDRIVSVGMFEHVGAPSFKAFFDTIKENLAPRGIALVHSIGRMEPPGGRDPWINKYIFPDGYIPALSETLAAIERSGLWVTDIEILRIHYADTLRHWYERFQDRREQAHTLYDERFCRMWEFYLAACEMMFRNGSLMVFQIQLAQERDAVPLTRDYLHIDCEPKRSIWDSQISNDCALREAQQRRSGETA